MSDTTTESVVRVTGPINAAGLEMTLETGKLATPRRRRRPRAGRRHHAAVHRVHVASPARASTSSRSPSTSRSACTPRARSPARSSAAKAAPASPRSSPAASPTGRCARRSPPTSATRCRSSPPSSAPTSMNPHDIASINGASAALTVSGIPFNGPIGAVRLAHHDGEWIAHPTFQEGDESTFELVVAGRRARRRRHRDHDGRGRRHRAHVGALRGGRAEGHRGGDRRGPRSVEAVDRRVDRPPDSSSRAAVVQAHGPIAPIDVHAQRRLPRPTCSTRSPSSTPRPRPPRRWRSPTRPTATTRLDEIHDGSAARARRHRRRARARSPVAAGAVKQAFRSLQKEVVRSAHRQRGRAHRRSRHRPTSGRSRPRSASSPTVARLRPVPAGRDPGAVGRSRSACPAWSRCSTRSRSTTASATCTTTTSRRSPPARRAASVRRSAARSVTARSPSGRCCRCVPTQARVALHAARRLRRARVERLHLDGVGLRLDAVADGRGCADQGAGRRHRDGPRVRRGQVHDAHRHPRCRGRVRRHGLQGRRHVASSSPRCSSTRRSTASPPTCSRRRCAQAKDARLEDPRGHARRDRRAPRRRARDRTEDRQLRDPDRQDRRGDRAQGQGHQHDPAGDRRRHLGAATTASSASCRIGSKDGADGRRGAAAGSS